MYSPCQTKEAEDEDEDEEEVIVIVKHLIFICNSAEVLLCKHWVGHQLVMLLLQWKYRVIL